MIKIEAIPFSPGVAHGKLVLLVVDSENPVRCTVKATSAELSRLTDAVEAAKKQLNGLYERALSVVNRETASIFRANRMMLEDMDYLGNIRHLIQSDALCAEYAVYATGIRFSKMFSAMENDEMKARAADIRDISESLLAALRGESNPTGIISVPAIIAVRELLPSRIVQLDKKKVLAVVTQKGSVNSHASILARGMGIPVVLVQGEAYEELTEGNDILVDGNQGKLFVKPDSDTLAYYRQEKELRKTGQDHLKRLVGLPAVTKDGAAITLCANIGHPDEVKTVLENDAEGIGLFRSEFLFFENEHFPSEEQQFEAYKKVLERMNPRRVVIRTLDWGADKQPSCFHLPKQENPAMGYRAIRISLDRIDDVFVPQLRALLRASVYGRLAVMFPMITGVEEVTRTFDIINTVKDSLKAECVPYSDNIEWGIMIETPAAVVMADKLAEWVDFFSIGTNDLTQYTFAVDRLNEKISYLYDCGHPAVLRMVKRTVEIAHEKGIWVGICGESAAELKLLPCYIAMGVDTLSFAPQAILKTKEAIREFTKSECIGICNKLLG